MTNQHLDSTFESFLEEESIKEDVTAAAVARVDAYLRTYSLNDTELAALKKFNNHRCPKHRIAATTVSFTPSGIGSTINVSCTCGKTKNITDYTSW